MQRVPVRSGPASALAILAVLLSACLPPTPVPESPNRPGTPGTPLGYAAVESLRAYLRTFRLDEKTLIPGLTIPYLHADGDFEGNVGAFRATGKIGPGGHQVYEIVNIYRNNDLPSNSFRRQYIEIAPDPEPSAAPPAAKPPATPPPAQAP